MKKRIFLVVLDSMGIGGALDAATYGDEGSNTLGAIAKSPKFNAPNLRKMGLFNIDGVEAGPKEDSPIAAFGRLQERSKGKDTTVGHWEMAGLVSEAPLPTFPDGFPKDLLEEFEKLTGKKTLCGLPYSGTDVIRDYGEEHLKTGALIVYTSADSVFQIAANEKIVPLEELYNYCAIARKMLTGKWGVGRVIARPFVGDNAQNFKRSTGRHDYSLEPAGPTILDDLISSCLDVVGVGKIYDIFAGHGISRKIPTAGNAEGIEVMLEMAEQDFEGLCFINLVDFDMIYGHRNDVDGYANAATEFDIALGKMLPLLGKDDLLMITADHGCDPSTPSTDHSREDVMLLVAGDKVKEGANFGTENGFSCVANTIAEYFELEPRFPGKSLWQDIKK